MRAQWEVPGAGEGGTWAQLEYMWSLRDQLVGGELEAGLLCGDGVNGELYSVKLVPGHSRQVDVFRL